MSALFFVKFNKKELSFDALNKLANEIVGDALKNNYAVAFNDEYLGEAFNKEKDITILLSDSFLYRHGDELLDVTEFVCESEKEFKLKFMKKFSFLTKLIDTLFQAKIREVDICFADTDESVPLIVTTKNDLLTDLYNEFITSSSKTGFTFPNLKIQVIENV